MSTWWRDKSHQSIIKCYQDTIKANNALLDASRQSGKFPHSQSHGFMHGTLAFRLRVISQENYENNVCLNSYRPTQIDDLEN
jgi:hypothetical protein